MQLEKMVVVVVEIYGTSLYPDPFTTKFYLNSKLLYS